MGWTVSFDVFLIPTSASPGAAMYDQKVVAAARSAGARILSKYNGETSDGLLFEMYGGQGTGFSLHDISPGMCRVIFEAAKRTNSYIFSTGDVDYAVKPQGIEGKDPGMNMPVRTLATPQALCVTLQQGYRSWAGFRDAVRARVNPTAR
jgi:hypothetical protein